MQTVVQGHPDSSSGYVKLAIKLSAGGPAVGIAFALFLFAWLRLAGGNFLADVSMTLVGTYASFHVADILGCSDILATVALGMCMSLYVWTGLKKELKEPVSAVW